jgi:hypothetical protein
MNKLLAVGCSITHGSDTVLDRYDPANVEFSYAKHLADHYQAAYCNRAYPGASNELIFHRAVEELTTGNYTHCVVGWTSLHREAWEKDNMIWAFNHNYGQCTDNSIAELPFVKRHRLAHISSNRRELVSEVLRYWESLKIKLFNDCVEQKLTHYRTLLKLLCDQQKVKLIDISVLPNDQLNFGVYDVGIWLEQSRHPTVEEHELIFQHILNNYENI